MAGVALFLQLAASQSTLLPTVDLGYEVHRASLFNACLHRREFLVDAIR